MAILTLWDKAAGPTISRNTRAQDMNGGILFVITRNSMWANQLSFLKGSLIQRLNSFIGEDFVKDLRFQVGPLKVKEETARDDEEEEANTSLQDYREAGEWISSITDDGMKKAFIGLYMAYKGLVMKRKKKGWKSCLYCSALHEGEGEICPICAIALKGVDLSPIKALLYTFPWLRYEEVARALPGFSEVHYKASREELRRELGEELDRNLNEYAVNKSEEVRKKGIELANICYILKVGKRVDTPDESLLTQEFGPRIAVLFR